MDKIHSSAAAPAAGPYSQAIKAGGTIYVSGQIPADGSGALIQESITASTKQCCTNIQKILEEAGSSIDKVVRCGVYLTDMDYFQEMNAEYEKWFSHKPARSCIAVKQLPKGVKVEIDCIALS